MIYIKHVSKYGLTALILVVASQELARAEEFTQQNTVTKQIAPLRAEDNFISQPSVSTQLLKRRKSLLNDAVTAQEEIFKAISSLQKNDKVPAYKSLMAAAGKLDGVLVRDPSLKLAAMNVRSNIIDSEVTTEVLKETVSQAKKQLNEGNIQQARALLNPMVSEIRISTDSLPMATYPAAIRLAIIDIDDGKLKEAEQLLRATLDTVVTVEEVIPLPPLKAEKKMLEAEQLLKIDEAKNRQKADDLFNQAKQNLKLGKLLGYGDYKNLNDAITSAQSKIKDVTNDTNRFSPLNDFFPDLRN